MNENNKYICAFLRLTQSSSSFAYKLIEHFGNAESAWNAKEKDIARVEGLSKNSVEGFLTERKSIIPDECIDFLCKKNIRFISYEDNEYPYLLKQIDDFPVGLFVVGDLSACNLDKTIAVVGSRRASENAKITLKKILKGFYNTDICIVSGMAEGIDSVAHISAIEAGVKTIAVLGGGFDKIYPKSNIKMFEQIKDGAGAVITEYWPDVDAISWHFPARNRIVSGLSRGVLVAEAALKSGAMITARLALEQGRELMCMPGMISNPNTEGIYKLIKNGASIVTDYQDILDAMCWQINAEGNPVDEASSPELSEYEQIVLDAIKKDSLSMDELIIKTNLNIADLMVILTKLELDGIISKSNGEKYISLI
ncbi:DNA-processing protein DprA [bacterium]|nr:DNA-processing protein DprA [bacterium]